MSLTSRERWHAAIEGRPVDRPPVWMMRQAGRFLPEYRALRANHTFLEMCKTPELACEATMQPLRRFPIDAAILFSDILTVPEAMGIGVDFPGGPPVLSPVIRSGSDIAALVRPDVGVSLGYVRDALRLVREAVGPDRAALGFSGAPFTLACYMIEGQGSKTWHNVKAMMFNQPREFGELLDRITDVVIDYLIMQLEVGADAVQLFDTWAGELRTADYERVVLPSTRRIIEAVQSAGGKIVLFAKHAGHLLDATLQAGPDAIGMEWRIDPAIAAARAGALGIAVQGNLDPVELFADPDHIRARVAEIHAAVGGQAGHVFNLGHGVLPPTPISGVQAFIDAVIALAPADSQVGASPTGPA